jgi:hypothetical protein
MPGELARAERALGIDSRAIAFDNSVYEYQIDEVLCTARTGRLAREWKRWGTASPGADAVRRRPLQLRANHPARPDD